MKLELIGGILAAASAIGLLVTAINKKRVGDRLNLLKLNLTRYNNLNTYQESIKAQELSNELIPLERKMRGYPNTNTFWAILGCIGAVLALIGLLQK